MATRKCDLTPQQEQTLLLLNDPDLDLVTIEEKTVQELMALGLVYRREDGVLDSTDEGEALYDSLTGRA